MGKYSDQFRFVAKLQYDVSKDQLVSQGPCTSHLCNLLLLGVKVSVVVLFFLLSELKKADLIFFVPAVSNPL